MHTRRRFLLSTVGVAAAAGAPASARAFRFVEPSPKARETYRAACTSSRYHEGLVERVRDDLAAQGLDLSADELRALLASRTCPLCGCSVAARTQAPPGSRE